MAEAFKLRIVTPEREFFAGEADMVELTTSEGDIGVYAKHIPMTAIVSPGVLKIHQGGEIRKAALHAGFVEIQPDAVTIMAEIAEWPEEIDVNRAKEAQDRAERRLRERTADIDIMRAEYALKRALARLGSRM